MEDQNRKICPYCKAEIQEGAEVIFCTTCGAPHHAGCWQANGGCAAEGCPAKIENTPAPAAEPAPTEVLGDEPAATEVLAEPAAAVAVEEAPEFVPVPEFAPAPIPTVCAQCGASLAPEQVFCTTCGHKNDLPVEPVENSAIEQFNQQLMQDTENKKKKKKKLGIILGIIGAVIVIAIALVAFFNSKAEKVLTLLNADYISGAKVVEEYNALTPLGQLFFREEIAEAFEATVSENVYASASNSLVNEDALVRYEAYKQIATALKIDESDPLVVHIDAVLQLNDYVKYNEIYRAVSASLDYYTDSGDYFDDATDFSSYYLMKLYIGYAHTYAQKALTAAQGYDSNAYLCGDYINALSDYEDQLSNLYYGYSVNSSSFGNAIGKISSIYNELLDAMNEVEDITEAIPALA